MSDDVKLLLSILVTQIFFPSFHCQLTQSGNKQEYDFEELSPENVTPSFDIEYNTEQPRSDASWELGCGSPPIFTGFPKIDINKPTYPKIKGRDDLPINKISPDNFIINGTRVKRGEIPWMVAITKFQYKKVPLWKVVCGAAVISDRYLLTASHCLDGRYKDQLEVVFNVDDATKITNDSLVIRKKIKRFILHEEYNSKTINNDIALIELKVPLDVSKLPKNLWPICLPKPRTDYSHEIGTVSGWGYTDFDRGQGVQGKPSTHLLRTYVPILTHKECLETKLPTKNNITSNMLCAGFVDDGGKDACLNDSGGPLTVEENGKSFVVGLVSWGIGCGLKGYPGVFTRVNNYLPWIRKHIAV